MSSKQIFISYRRSDTAGHAGRLYDFLIADFTDESIFFDANTIDPGVNFEQKINSELENSDVALVLIGNQWLDCRGKDGNRRLDDPKDYVRLEVATALSNNKTVIPVLLQGAEMPSSAELPDDLRDLSKRNAVKLNDDHWKSDCRTLSTVLTRALRLPTSLKEKTLRRNKAWMVGTMIAGAFLAIIHFVYFLDPSPQNFGLQGFTLAFILLSLIVRIGSLLMAFINVFLAAVVIRNMKREFDKLSWVIIIIGAIGAFMAASGGDRLIWVPFTTVIVAALLNLVVADS